MGWIAEALPTILTAKPLPPMNPPDRAPRFHALDGVRAFAMLLGVFLHAAVPYLQVPFPWAVVDPSRSVTLTLIVYAIHSFRMPAFFLIAGFFARLVFLRGGVGPFARHRAKRILVPFVVGWLILHPIVRGLWVWSGVRAMDGTLGDLWGALSTVFSAQFLTRGLGLMHLWFLYYLLLLYVAFLLLRWLYGHLDPHGRYIHGLDRAVARLVQSRLAAPALAVPTVWPLMMMQGWGVDFVTRSLVPRPAHMLYYGAFFAIGWMLHRQPNLLAALRRRWAFNGALAIVLYAPLIQLLYLIYVQNHDGGPWFRLLYFLLYGCMSWSFVLALLGLFERFFDRPSPTWRYVADASYWIYLVHLPIVIVASILLREFPVAWYFKLPIVLVASTPALLGSYQWFVRSTWIGVVLNGRRLPLRPSA